MGKKRNQVMDMSRIKSMSPNEKITDDLASDLNMRLGKKRKHEERDYY